MYTDGEIRKIPKSYMKSCLGHQIDLGQPWLYLTLIADMVKYLLSLH